ncbi:MAG: (2Fe-2S)-binding protein [Chloroflexota bacterium]|nr:(2Fe-2S)-binding protein [Chloroflexota bacterium]
MRFSRRQFLKGTGISVAGAAAAASLSASSAPGAAAAQVTPVVRVGPPAGAPGTALMQLTVNGTLYETAVDPRWTLAELLRDNLGLTGTKVGCDRGECGSCTVLLDGKAVLACSALAVEVEGRQVKTVESLSSKGQLSPLQQAFWEAGATQCGFCTPGMLMSATALLDAVPKPTADQVRLAISGNLCRCTGYKKIVEAVMAASGQPLQA